MTQRRRNKIKELITQYAIGTQSELVARLNAAGFDVTQATVSRDIRALRLMKASDGKGGRRYALPESAPEDGMEHDLNVFRRACLSVEEASGLIVVRTRSGMAMALAAVIDRMQAEQVAGCVAGDDTILVAIRSGADAEQAVRTIRQWMA